MSEQAARAEAVFFVRPNGAAREELCDAVAEGLIAQINAWRRSASSS